jgi:hypothetical protein
MKSARIARPKWAALVVALALAMSGARARADTVVAGEDYFHTLNASVDFSGYGNLGVIDFSSDYGPLTAGLDLLGGNADTWIYRESDAVINGAPIDISLTALSLESTAPVDLGGFFYYVHVSEYSFNVPDGTLSIDGGPNGGTFHYSLTALLNFDFSYVTYGVGYPFRFQVYETLTGSGNWSSTPGPGDVLITPSDHTETPNSHPGLGAGEVDFYPTGVWTFSDPTEPYAMNQTLIYAGANPPTTPTPAALWGGMLLFALLGTHTVLRRQFRTVA